MGISLEQKQNLLKAAIDVIPLRCCELIRRTGCLAWAETTEGGETMLLYTERARDARLLAETHQSLSCFNALQNLAMLYCHVPHFGFASREGILKEHCYTVEPGYEAKVIQGYVEAFDGDVDAAYAFNAAVLFDFLPLLFSDIVAPQALQLLQLARECHSKSESVTSHINKIPMFSHTRSKGFQKR